MLTFELSAIDLILAIAVVVLLLMYINKIEPKYPNQASFLKKIKDTSRTKKTTIQVQNEYVECPRGFGNIRKIDEDNSVSDRCLGCYRIMECYEEREDNTV